MGEAVQALKDSDPRKILTGPSRVSGEKSHVFMFSGQGAQYVNMGLGLYETQPTFRAQTDLCSDFLRPHLGLDLRDILTSAGSVNTAGPVNINQTAFTQPALFVLEYALARLWMEWGVRPGP